VKERGSAEEMGFPTDENFLFALNFAYDQFLIARDKSDL
jgi:hypothetical protein